MKDGNASRTPLGFPELVILFIDSYRGEDFYGMLFGDAKVINPLIMSL